jgi:MtN3 and saliva related transmembrane protein
MSQFRKKKIKLAYLYDYFRLGWLWGIFLFLQFKYLCYDKYLQKNGCFLGLGISAISNANLKIIIFMLFLKFYENYMKFIGPLGNLMFFMQAYKIFTTKTAVSISIEGFSLSVIGLGSWLLYGILLKNKPLIIANVVGVVGAVLVLVGTFIYG